MELRIHNLESEVYRLSTSLDDRDRSQNKVHHHHISRDTEQPTPLRQGTPTSTSTTTKSLNPDTQHNSKELRSVAKYDVILARKLEDNLERGDIASTLNDDYGEEQLFENSTEQYLDPLQREY